MTATNDPESRHAVVTLMIGHSRLWRYTRPSIEKYAQRCGADVLVIDDSSPAGANVKLRKFELHDLLERYSRVLYVDGDILIHPQCPNVFDMVAEDSLGAVAEMPPLFRSRKEILREACEYYGTPPPSDKEGEPLWFNSGLILASRAHRDLFRIDGTTLKTIGKWFDMPFLNARARALGISVHDLGINFNFLGSVVTNPHRPYDAYMANVFHATGQLKVWRYELVRTVSWIWSVQNDSGLFMRPALPALRAIYWLYRKSERRDLYRIKRALRSALLQLRRSPTTL